MDFSTLDITAANKKLHSIFSVQTDIKIFESYCETWARVMNVFFESYFELNRHSRILFTPLTTRKKFVNNVHRQHFVSLKNRNSVTDKKERFLNIFPLLIIICTCYLMVEYIQWIRLLHCFLIHGKIGFSVRMWHIKSTT